MREPTIDRGLSIRKPKRKLSISAIGLVLAILFVLVIAAVPIITEKGYQKQPENVAGISYFMHSPIYIDGNSGFTNASGVVWGSGTPQDPYIIENWEIDASTAHGIHIANTNAYFIVRNCYVHGGGSDYNGIHLYNCTHGVLDKNTCSNNDYGIGLCSSSSNSISNNTCYSNNDYGIYLDSSSSNSISNNNCSNNWCGIDIWWYSNNNWINNNTCCSNDLWGIILEYSNNNCISNNTCCLNSFCDGISLLYSDNNNISNNTCSNNYDYGISLTWYSDSNAITNNTCSNNYLGIYLAGSSSNAITNNTCSNNWDGIYLDSSSSNIISNNRISDNTGYGIRIYPGSNFNRIWNNSFYNNNGATSVYDPSHIQACDYGTGNLWNTSGTPHGFGNYWSDWTSPDTNIDGVVDNPYVIDGSAHAKDYYPLTQFPYIPEFSSTLIPIAFTLLAVILISYIRRGREER